MDVEQFTDLIIDPTLKAVDLYSPASSQLMLGTALAESDLSALKQYGGGPALGFFQIEPITFSDVFHRYLYRPDKAYLLDKIVPFMLSHHIDDGPYKQVIGNMYFALLIARVRYYMKPEALPEEGDIEGMAVYWKKHYNTSDGSGTIKKYMSKWKDYVLH